MSLVGLAVTNIFGGGVDNDFVIFVVGGLGHGWKGVDCRWECRIVLWY